MSEALSRLRRHQHRNEVLVLLALLALIPLMPAMSSKGPKSVPLAIWVLGAVPGAALAMQAMGVVLVYRSNRFINFGQVYLGSVGAAFFVLASRYTPVHRYIREVCPRCLSEEPTDLQYKLYYWGAVVVGLLLVMALSWLMYVLIVRRFERMSRLIVTVASIFVGSVSLSLIGLVRNTLTTVQQREDGLLAGTSPLPYDFEMVIGVAEFNLGQLVTIIVGVVVTLVLMIYLRRSRTGQAIRAAADNPARAELLGIDVNRVHTRVWFIVGFLAAVPAMLAPMSGSAVVYDALTVDGAVRVLVVAVFARFSSIPMAAFAAFVIGIVETASLWSFSNATGPFNGAIVILVAGLLLVRSREQTSRADSLAFATLNTSREARPIPAELRSLPSVRSWVRTSTVMAVLFIVGLPWALSPGQTNLASIAFIYGILGLSLLVLTGWAGQISLGQFAFAAIGGYVVATWSAPAPVTLIAGGLLGAVVATLVGIPALRLRGLYLAIATMALAVSTTAIVVSPQYLGSRLPTSLARPALFGMDLEDQRVFYYLSLVLLLVTVVVVRGLRNSRTGRALIAARENEEAVQSFGVSLVRIRLSAFAVSGFLAAFAGGMLAFHQHGMPLSAFNEQQSLLIFTMTVIGGVGSVAGPLIGATYQGILLVFNQSPAVTAFFLGFGGLGLLLLAPGGLGQVFYDLRDGFLRRVAKRNRIIVPSLIADVKASQDDRRAALMQHTSAVGGKAYVPRRYEPDHQWAVNPPEHEVSVDNKDFIGVATSAGQGE